MKIKHILYLASQSWSRRALLEQAKIPFEVITQDADESQCDWNLPLPQVVKNIALYKMEHAVVPDGIKNGQICFVLTSDTLSQSLDGITHGKPVDKEDAIQKLRESRNGSRLCTAFCIDKKIWQDGSWHMQKQIVRVVKAEYTFDVPEEWIETYFDNSIAMRCAGAIAIEDFGNLFLKEVRGSYGAIVGLPLFEVRHALIELGFFE